MVGLVAQKEPNRQIDRSFNNINIFSLSNQSQALFSSMPVLTSQSNNVIWGRDQINELQQSDHLIIVAHPDDDAAFLPGLVTWLRSQKDSVQVAFLTIGEKGWDRRGELERESFIIAEQRRQELIAAFSEYNIPTRPLVLGYPNRGMLDKQTSIIQDLLKILERVQPKHVYSFDPGGMSNHIDHKIAGKLTYQAVGIFNQVHGPSASLIRLHQVAYSSDVLKALKEELEQATTIPHVLQYMPWWFQNAVDEGLLEKLSLSKKIMKKAEQVFRSYVSQFQTVEFESFGKIWHKFPFLTFRIDPSGDFQV